MAQEPPACVWRSFVCFAAKVFGSTYTHPYTRTHPYTHMHTFNLCVDNEMQTNHVVKLVKQQQPANSVNLWAPSGNIITSRE